MKEVIENICEITDECGVDLCDIDTLVRIDEKDEVFLSCVYCIFNDVDNEFGLGMAGCPYECTDNVDILR